MLNGGLGEVSPVFWLALLLGFAALENGTLDYQFSGWQSTGKLVVSGLPASSKSLTSLPV